MFYMSLEFSFHFNKYSDMMYKYSDITGWQLFLSLAQW